MAEKAGFEDVIRFDGTNEALNKEAAHAEEVNQILDEEEEADVAMEGMEGEDGAEEEEQP